MDVMFLGFVYFYYGTPAGKEAIMSQPRVWPFPFTTIVIFGERSRNPDHHFAGVHNYKITVFKPKNIYIQEPSGRFNISKWVFLRFLLQRYIVILKEMRSGYHNLGYSLFRLKTGYGLSKQFDELKRAFPLCFQG